MEHFTEEHSKLLLNKEWLVKIDSQNSTPYLIKFYSSSIDLSCCILITDTKTTWAEVLTSTQCARRWRDCNRKDASFSIGNERETAWRTNNLELLSKAHTLGGIMDLTFEIVDSRYADLAFELECDTFKWRWETVFIGYKVSAEILSKHLIMPLVSVNHLAFSSADPVCELSESDLEKAVDKVGRTARRTPDTHVKHAISKPRVSTTLQRMTAMINFTSTLPAIVSTTEEVGLQIQVQPPDVRHPSEKPTKSRQISPHPIVSIPFTTTGSPLTGTAIMKPNSPDILSTKLTNSFPHADSATESDSEGGPSILDRAKGKGKAVSLHPRSPELSPKPLEQQSVAPSRQISPLPVASAGLSHTRGPSSDSESSPLRPAKKAKPQLQSSDDDSEEERKKHVAQLKSRAGVVKRGTRQPIKRGGKRF